MNAYAAQALSKPIIQQYSQATSQLAKLLDSHPDIQKQLSDLMILNKKEKLALIQSLPIYPKVTSIVTGTGFNDVEEFLDTGLRIMSATVNLEMEKMPNNMNITSYIKQMKSQASEMKKEGASKEVINKMESAINMKIESMKTIEKISKNASKADIKFVNDNLDWVTQVMQSDVE
jgi:hypothetical protein